MKRNILIFFIASAVLASCGKVYYVPVSHIFTQDGLVKQQYNALRHVYVMIKKPSTLTALDLKKTTTDISFGDRSSGFDIRLFAHLLDKGLSRIGCSVLAYRVTDKAFKSDRYAKRLSPTGNLMVVFKNLKIKHVAEKEVKQVTDKKGNTTTRTYYKTAYTGSVIVSCKLRPPKSINMLFNITHPVTVKKEFNRAPSVDDEITVIRSLVAQAAAILTAQLSPSLSVRRRPLYRSKDDNRSKEAYKLARKNKWDKAEEIWAGRLEAGVGDWRDSLNLGVSSERKRDYSKASAYYQKAREGSAGNKDTRGIKWDAINNDITQSLIRTLGPHTASEKWFGHRIAVLPFSDETVSIDGPVNIRKLVHDTLTKGGYAAIPLEEVDTVLRNNGFTQGGQLRATTPEKISAWLNADWLLYGHITEFNKINVGVYVKKSIEGVMYLWDRKKKKKFWTADKSINIHSIPSSIKNGGIIAHFLKNIGESLIESIKNKPLSSESVGFVVKSLEQFPLKPYAVSNKQK